jgi:hypothetical protein
VAELVHSGGNVAAFAGETSDTRVSLAGDRLIWITGTLDHRLKPNLRFLRLPHFLENHPESGLSKNCGQDVTVRSQIESAPR